MDNTLPEVVMKALLRMSKDTGRPCTADPALCMAALYTYHDTLADLESQKEKRKKQAEVGKEERRRVKRTYKQRKAEEGRLAKAAKEREAKHRRDRATRTRMSRSHAEWLRDDLVKLVRKLPTRPDPEAYGVVDDALKRLWRTVGGSKV